MSHVQFEMFCSEVLPYPYSEFGICAIYYGDNVQWTTIIEVIPENWSTTSRTTFEDQWRHNLEEEINTAFSMFGGNIE